MVTIKIATTTTIKKQKTKNLIPVKDFLCIHLIFFFLFFCFGDFFLNIQKRQGNIEKETKQRIHLVKGILSQCFGVIIPI